MASKTIEILSSNGKKLMKRKQSPKGTRNLGCTSDRVTFRPKAKKRNLEVVKVE